MPPKCSLAQPWWGWGRRHGQRKTNPPGRSVAGESASPAASRDVLHVVGAAWSPSPRERKTNSLDRERVLRCRSNNFSGRNFLSDGDFLTQDLPTIDSSLGRGYTFWANLF